MTHHMIIDGEATEGAGSFDVINPATGDVLGQGPTASQEQVTAAIEAARRAQPAWAARSSEERAAMLNQVADVFEANAAALAELITKEQGKPLSGPGSMFEMEAAVGFTRVPAMLDLPPEVVFEDETRVDELHYDPLGVVAAIAPWNWPVMIAVWQIMPAVRMGNTVVIKPSELTPLGTLELVRLINTVLPPGVVNAVSGDGEVGSWLVSSSDVDKIMFTGSVATGKKVAAAASASLTRTTMELGGNDPAIIMGDVDPAAIAEGLFWGSFINMGQTCACAKRLYVHDDVYDAVVDGLVSLAEAMPMGDGLEEGNVLGPIQNKAQFDKVASFVDQAKASGATIRTGGAPMEGNGYFYPITIVTDICDDALLVAEEQFGPAIPVIRFSDNEEAIAKANADELGLGASVWSSDVEQAKAVAKRLQAGTVWINQHGAVHPMVPFGGAKGSGFGVEFGVDGLKAVTQPKALSTAK
ncbi:MAG: aldehyde dehydrogenase family protein [Actinomycetota bacterium]